VDENAPGPRVTSISREIEPPTPRARWIWIVVPIMALFALWFINRPIHSNIPWLTDVEQAKAFAQEQDKPVLLYFTADWCAGCNLMSRRTWPDERIEKLVMGSFIPVKIDMSDAAQPQPIADAYAVFGLPTVLVTDAEGRTLKGIEGYVDADDLLAQLAP
jgi:thioredoxin 1